MSGRTSGTSVEFPFESGHDQNGRKGGFEREESRKLIGKRGEKDTFRIGRKVRYVTDDITVTISSLYNDITMSLSMGRLSKEYGI